MLGVRPSACSRAPTAATRGAPSIDTWVGALAIDPTTSTTLYAGMQGGVFKSTDGGDSWQAASAGLPADQVRVIAIDPSTPRTLYAGTDRAGLFKSTDGGATWSARNIGLTHLRVTALAIDPTNPTILYAGTEDGDQYGSADIVFKSTNGAESWIASSVRIGVSGSVSVSAIIIEPVPPTTLYIGIFFNGIFKSTDGGRTGLTNLTVSALAIDPVAPRRLYAATAGGGVFAIEQIEAGSDGGDGCAIRPSHGSVRAVVAARAGGGTARVERKSPTLSQRSATLQTSVW